MSVDWTRRDFLRQAAATAAALAAGSQLALGQATTKATTQAKAKPAPATTQTKYAPLRVGFIGVGGKGRHNLNAVTECGVTIAALCDIDAKRLADAVADHPKAKTYTDFRKMLEAQKDLDAVVVSTPDHTHASAAMMALKLGKPVYCEKPLTHNISEARKLVEAARQAKVATQMGNQGHSSEGSANQIQWIKSGVIGNVKEVHLWTDRPIWPQGCTRPTDNEAVPETVAWDLWLGPAPARPYNKCYHPFAWRGWWDFGTGALGDMACHIMDTAYWALDLRDPTAVEAFSEGATSESPPKWSIIRYEFPKRGERPAVKVFWYDGKLLPPRELVGKKELAGGGNGIIFVGEKGTIMAPLNGDPQIVDEKLAKEFKPPAKATTRPGGHDHWHHLEWLEACMGGPKPSSNFDYAGGLTEMVLLGNLAVRTGRRCEWDAKSAKVTNVPEANQYVSREYRKGWEL